MDVSSSGGQDALQLVSEKTMLYLHQQGKTETTWFNPELVRSTGGV